MKKIILSILIIAAGITAKASDGLLRHLESDRFNPAFISDFKQGGATETNPDQIYQFKYFDPKTARVFTVHVVGSGSGTVSVTSMSGYTAGDIAAITAGSYSYSAFSNLTGIFIYPNSTLVTWTGSIDMNSNTNVTFDGSGGTLDPGTIDSTVSNYRFKFSGVTSSAGCVNTNGANKNVKWRYLYFLNNTTDAFDNQSNITNMDTTAGRAHPENFTNKKFLKCTWEYIYGDNCYGITSSFRGNYANVTDSGLYQHLYWKRGNANQLFTFNGVYATTVYDLRVTEFTANANATNDLGLFYIQGTIHLINVWESGANWGWIARNFNSSIHANDTAIFANLLKVSVSNSRSCYGMVEGRQSDTTTSLFMYGVDTYMFNFLGVNMPMPTINNFYTGCIDYGHMGHIWKIVNFGRVHSRNQNNTPKIGDTTMVVNFETTTNPGGLHDRIIELNCGYIEDGIASGYLTDTVSCKPTSTSPWNSAGTTSSLSLPNGTKDLAGVSWGSTPSIGVYKYTPSGGSTVTANAGTNQTITSPTNSLTVNAGASSSSGSTIASYAWTQTSGPSSTITSPSSVSSTITGMNAAGTYVYTVLVTDALASTGNASVTETVNSVVAANAGTNQSITRPTSSLTLNASASTSTGSTISTYAWTKTSGPTCTITTPTFASTTVTGMTTSGTYVFQVTVTDAWGSTNSATVTETVNSLVTADAGTNQTITLPTTSLNLNASASTSLGSTISSYAWTKVSGPACTISPASSATPTITGMTPGTYVFNVLVTDAYGSTGNATVTETVNAGGSPPPGSCPQCHTRYKGQKTIFMSKP